MSSEESVTLPHEAPWEVGKQNEWEMICARGGQTAESVFSETDRIKSTISSLIHFMSAERPSSSLILFQCSKG